MNTDKNKLKLTGVIFEDTENGGFTGYFLEFPDVIVEANTKEEIKASLLENLNATLLMNAEENQPPVGENYSTETFEFAL